MFALIDCNSFYASCEQVFRPDLRGKIVCVLSNNDGCIVAQSREAKEIGIPSFAPYFKVKPLLDKHGAVVFSSNYALYGDLSNRVVQTLRDYAADIEIYSIDEVFVKPVDCFGDLKNYGQTMRKAVWKNVRIPVGVGIAPTKTLAKLANRAAKKIKALDYVCVLEREDQRDWLLRRVEVGDIWGVGSRLSKRLQAMGIYSGLDLARTNPKHIRAKFNVCLERTVQELNGVSCLELEEVPVDKKQIYCTRAYGTKTDDLNEILQATSSYAARASEKLRKQNQLAKTLHVFLQTSRFDRSPLSKSTIVQLPYPTDDTRIIVRYAIHAIKSIYEEGHLYSKSGVGLVEIIDRSITQFDLFSRGQSAESETLMRVIDSINKRYGRGSIFTAAEGVDRKWVMNQNFKSPSYTTNWNQLPVVKC